MKRDSHLDVITKCLHSKQRADLEQMFSDQRLEVRGFNSLMMGVEAGAQECLNSFWGLNPPLHGAPDQTGDAVPTVTKSLEGAFPTRNFTLEGTFHWQLARARLPKLSRRIQGRLKTLKRAKRKNYFSTVLTPTSNTKCVGFSHTDQFSNSLDTNWVSYNLILTVLTTQS